MMTSLEFTTLCGHKVTSKPTRHGDQWISKIVGPKAGKSGSKTVYSDPNEDATKERVAKFLRVSMANLVASGSESEPPSSPRKVVRQVPSKRSLPASTRPFTQKQRSAPIPGPSILTVRSSLREALREMRESLAKDKGTAPHNVFDDSTLNAIVAILPLSEVELATIRGFGEMKVLEYGPWIFAIIRRHQEDMFGVDGGSPSKKKRVLFEV